MSNLLDGLTTFLGGLGGTIVLLMPGYVLSRVYSRGVRGPELSEKAFVAATAIGGIITHVFMLVWTIPLIRILYSDSTDGTGDLDIDTYINIASWVLIALLLFPALLGAAFSHLSERRSPDWFYWALRKLGLSSALRTERAWNWIFGELDRLEQGSWVRVRLKEGEGIFFGKFGRRSFAASDASVRDLYLEQTWPVNDSGQPLPDGSANSGVWLTGDRIMSVEFLTPFKGAEATDGQGA